MICRKCGTANAANATNCSNCGETLRIEQVSAGRGPFSFAERVVITIVGFCFGLLAIFGLYAIPETFLINFPRPSHEEFGMSHGAAWGYVFELIAVAASLVFLFLAPAARRMPSSLRFVLLTGAWMALGGMALCNLFAVQNLLKP